MASGWTRPLSLQTACPVEMGWAKGKPDPDLLKHRSWRDFPSSPVVRTRCFHCRGLGLIPGQGTKVPQALWRSQEKKYTKHRSWRVAPGLRAKGSTGGW